MAIIKPFRALRPAAGLAAEVASLPYDVMNADEARAMAAGHPLSFLHVSRAEIDLPTGTDIHSPAVYQRAAENFRALISGSTLVWDRQPCLYVYAQTMDGRRQVGLVACSAVEDYFSGVIKKHELTRPDKEQDRIDHMEALHAHVGPVFLTYRPHAAVSAIIASVTATAPVYDFTAEDGIQHTLWMISDAAQIDMICRTFEQEVPATYIADGHHRTASAAKVGLMMKEQNPSHTGEEEYNFFLSVLFPADELAIMDYNRVVTDLNGMTPADLLSRLSERFIVAPVSSDATKPMRLHDFGMYIGGQWYLLTARGGTYTADPIGVLDVTILQQNILAPLLGITDQRTDRRIDFVGGIRGLKALESRVDSGEMAVAFALYPVSLKQLMDIADSGNIMPPKSTWFEPKLRDGIVSHLF